MWKEKRKFFAKIGIFERRTNYQLGLITSCYGKTIAYRKLRENFQKKNRRSKLCKK